MLVSTRVTVELPSTSSRHIIRNRILKHKRARVPLLREDDLDVFMITGLLPTIAPYSWAFLSLSLLLPSDRKKDLRGQSEYTTLTSKVIVFFILIFCLRSKHGAYASFS